MQLKFTNAILATYNKEAGKLDPDIEISIASGIPYAELSQKRTW